MTEDNRYSERKESMIVIEFRKAGTTDDYYAGITHNFSDDGFSFESEALALQLGPVLDFKLKHSYRDEAINFLGVVVWTTKQKYSLVAGIKFHSVPTEKQNILAEILSLSPSPADSVTRKELRPVQNESSSDIITESIVSAVRKSSAEETGSAEETDISEAVPPEVRTEISGSASKVKNRPGKLSPVLIIALIISASAVLAGYFIFNSSTEKIDPEPALNQEVEKTDPAPAFEQEVEKAALDQDVDLLPSKGIPSESVKKGPETLEAVEVERFIVYVSAWKTKGYAMYFYKKVVSLYPDAIIAFENDHHIVMVPNIASREEALLVAEELASSLDVSPLIYVQQRSLP